MHWFYLFILFYLISSYALVLFIYFILLSLVMHWSYLFILFYLSLVMIGPVYLFQLIYLQLCTGPIQFIFLLLYLFIIF